MITLIYISVTMKAKTANSNKGQKFPAELLTDEDVEALLGACSRRGSAGVRNRALISVIYRGMLRIDEALSLVPSDVDLDRQTILVKQGKRRKRRLVGLPSSTCDAVARWLDVRKELKVGARKPVFCGIENGEQRCNLGEKLDASYIRHLLPRLAKKVGIEKRVHAHAFRHSGAVRLLRAGNNVGVISKGLGHSSIAVTHRYLDHLSPEEVIDAMREE